jgi:hypothetical protein
MLVVTGFFDHETFVPDKPVDIPQKKKVIVTIEEEKDSISGIDLHKEREERLAALRRITGIISGNTMTLEETRTERLSRQ